MTCELKDGQGSLFRNDRKQSTNHPDYRGDLKVEGIEFKLAGWVKETRDGRKFLSLSAMPKEQRRPTRERDDSYNDEIPF
jgi:uncharacterized protein (DUF736 family)